MLISHLDWDDESETLPDLTDETDPLTASYLAYCDECEERNDYYRQIESGVGL